MSYAYLKARNARWWISLIFSVWLGSTIAAGAAITSFIWPSDEGLRAGLAQSYVLPSAAWIEWRRGEPRIQAAEILDGYDRCIEREILNRPRAGNACQKIKQDVEYFFVGSLGTGAVVAVSIIVFVFMRGRKNRNRDEQLRGSSITSARQLARRVNQLDPD
jgi:hypothetical protein